MKIDPEDFRRHYDSLSDEALLEIERDELVPVAQQIYDAEISRRHLMTDEPERQPPVEDQQGSGFHADEHWLENSTSACSAYIRSAGDDGSQRMLLARDILTSAGIPAEVNYRPEEKNDSSATDICEVMVPAHLSLYAASVLDKEIFNPEVEETYRLYFSSLSDEELRSADRKLLFAGLADRLERARKTYDEEVARRARTAGA